MIKADKLRFSVLSREQIIKIHETTLELLGKTGVVVGEEKAIDLLYQNGAEVIGDVVRIPEQLVSQALRSAPKMVQLYDRAGENVLDIGGDNVYFGAWLENLYIYDPKSGKLRSPVLDDVEYTAIVCDQSDNLDWFSWGGQISDVPSLIREPMIYRKALPYTIKPCVSNTVDENALQDIIDMAAVMAGGYDVLREKPFLANASEPISPLHLSRSGVKKLFLCADYGIPICYYPMPAAGSSAPCYPVGPVVIGNIEVLAGLVIHQLHEPGAPFIYGNMPGMMDMKTTTWAYGAPELLLSLAAMTELAHWYGLPVYGTAGCGDSMEIDGQLGVEYALSVQHSVLSGANLVHDPGIFGGGIFAGAEALVFVDEVIGMIRHITCGLEVTSETLATDLIHEIGPRGSFLPHPSTVENYRSFWYPTVFSRESGQDWINSEKRTTLKDRLRNRVTEMISVPNHYDIDKVQQEALQDIEKRMRMRAE
jgi:trimethylamine--corrinoid protein Co-methyltransferase